MDNEDIIFDFCPYCGRYNELHITARVYGGEKIDVIYGCNCWLCKKRMNVFFL